MQDGITASETRAIEYLYATDLQAPAVAEQMLEASWVQDGVTEAESEAMQYIHRTARRAPALAQRMLGISWMQGGLTKAESQAIDYAELIYRYDEDFALAMLNMPFLRTLEFDDHLAVMAIHRLSRSHDDGRLETLKEHPTLEGGITDELTTLVAAAGTIREADEVERMLDPGYARIEVFTGQTELTPELKISIVRTHSEPRPETMPELVRIAELLESTMQVPLPKPHMIFGDQRLCNLGVEQRHLARPALRLRLWPSRRPGGYAAVRFPIRHRPAHAAIRDDPRDWP